MDNEHQNQYGRSMKELICRGLFLGTWLTKTQVAELWAHCPRGRRDTSGKAHAFGEVDAAKGILFMEGPGGRLRPLRGETLNSEALGYA